MKPSRFLAIDPGETTGWAEFDEDGFGIGLGQVKQIGLTKFLTDHVHSELKAVICEDYKNHGFTQQKRWSRNQTSKNIGKIEVFAELHGVTVILQPNTVKGIGYMWSGIDPPSNHGISHQYDAYVHGVYYLQSNGIRKPGQGLNLETVN